MNRYQRVASKLAKDLKINEQFNDYNTTKNMYLNIFKKNSWPISKVQEFKNIKKEKVIIKENVKIITDFIDSLTMGNTRDSFVNSIDFDIIDDCNMRNCKGFFYELDEYFRALNATYSYKVDGNLLSFTVIIINND